MFSFIVVLLSTSSLNRHRIGTAHRPCRWMLPNLSLHHSTLHGQLLFPVAIKIFSGTAPARCAVDSHGMGTIPRTPRQYGRSGACRIIDIPRISTDRPLHATPSAHGILSIPCIHPLESHRTESTSPQGTAPCHTTPPSRHKKRRPPAKPRISRRSRPGGRHTQRFQGFHRIVRVRKRTRACRTHRTRPLGGQPGRSADPNRLPASHQAAGRLTGTPLRLSRHAPEPFGDATADVASELTSGRTGRDAMRRADRPRQRARGRP